MGSAFEPWELDDGGIDRKGLSASAGSTRILLAVDKTDTANCYTYFNDNLAQFRSLGFDVETFEPNEGTHDVTDAMKAVVLRALRDVPAR